jgi:hypothetical protein
MNDYEPSTPRAALGLTAVAMAAITMGALVVLPAKLGSVSTDPHTLATTKGPIEVPMSPAGIDVPKIGNREEHVAGRTATGTRES